MDKNTTELITSVLLVIGIVNNKTITYAQTSSCYDSVVMPKSSTSGTLPVILIHGYYEGSGVWLKWESYLRQDGIAYCTVSFQQSDDQCGSAIDHGNELSQIVQKVK